MHESWKNTKYIFWLQKMVKIWIWWHFQICDPKYVYISFLLFLGYERFIPLVRGGPSQGISVRVIYPPERNKDFSAHITWYGYELLYLIKEFRFYWRISEKNVLVKFSRKKKPINKMYCNHFEISGIFWETLLQEPEYKFFRWDLLVKLVKYPYSPSRKLRCS